MRPTTRLRQLIEREEILIAPGAYDPYLAKCVQLAGFEAVYMTGAGVSHSSLGMPDLGLLTFTEMVDRAARIADAVEIPLFADADTGYGNALNVMRTVRAYERAGVAGLHLEDQELPKSEAELARLGASIGKPLLANMVETGLTPILPAERLQALGFAVAIYPGALGRFIGKQALEFLRRFRAEGTTLSQLDRMLTFKEQNEIVGLPQFQALARKYGA